MNARRVEFGKCRNKSKYIKRQSWTESHLDYGQATQNSCHPFASNQIQLACLLAASFELQLAEASLDGVR